MVDENELKRINWSELFSFTHIFKCFKIAMHAGKMSLALAAIVLVFCFGWAMDKLWSTVGSSYVFSDEISQHYLQTRDNFAEWKKEQEASRLDKAAELLAQIRTEKHDWTEYQALSFKDGNTKLAKAFEAKLQQQNEQYTKPDKKAIKETAKNWKSVLDDCDDGTTELGKTGEEMLDGLDKDALALLEKEGNLTREDREYQKAQIQRDLQSAWRGLTALRVRYRTDIARIRGGGVFASLLDYQMKCLGSSLASVQNGNFFGGLTMYRQRAGGGAAEALSVHTGQEIKLDGSSDTGGPRGILETEPAPAAAKTAAQVPAETPGFFYWILMGIQGFAWLITEHWVYALVLLAFSLAVWAILGGAIYRIAALHAAREEKISMFQALRFSLSKFLSFVSAPLLPLAIIVGIGLLISVGALLGNIPYVGEVLVSLLFALSIIGGVAIAFLTLGWFTGGSLMYPTIAVEGSDCFDAISRSFSYVLTRPWRAGLYALIALVYGTITYLVVRLFVYLALSATHLFLKIGVFTPLGVSPLGGGDKIDIIWAAPTFDNLWGSFHWEAMNGSEAFAAWVIGIFTFLMAAIAGAYILSYFASSTTMVYLLLRRRVDATDLDDVYVEEADETPKPLEVTPAAPVSQEVAPEAPPTLSPAAEAPPPSPEVPKSEPPTDKGPTPLT